jgi:hypothetical protein
MPSLPHFTQRRKQFLDAIDNPVLLMAGGWLPRNYPQNPHPYRPDSNFLFLFGPAEPDAAALFDPKDRSVTLFLNERTPEDALWHGQQPGFADMKKIHGVSAVSTRGDMPKLIKQQAGRRKVHGGRGGGHRRGPRLPRQRQGRRPGADPGHRPAARAQDRGGAGGDARHGSRDP